MFDGSDDLLDAVANNFVAAGRTETEARELLDRSGARPSRLRRDRECAQRCSGRNHAVSIATRYEIWLDRLPHQVGVHPRR